MKKILIAVVLLIIIGLIIYFNSAEKGEVIKIGNKEYTEQRLVGQLMAEYLQSKGYKTSTTELTGTMLIFTALDNGNIDVYPEFTGTAYGAILNQDKIIGSQETYDYVKKNCEDKYGVTWLKPLGWNNTYVLSVREETQKKYNLKTIDDLVKVAPEMVIGCDKEFQNRADGLPGLQKFYDNLRFKEVIPMDQGLTYAALNNGDIDINVSYATDGRIAKFNLINLEDNRNFFPPYHLTPILKISFAESHPGVIKALEELGGLWTNADMQKYNLMVDEGQKTKDVARLMLKESGLIK